MSNLYEAIKLFNGCNLIFKLRSTKNDKIGWPKDTKWDRNGWLHCFLSCKFFIAGIPNAGGKKFE